MRISELSAASQVPIPTIKYYLREGLLPQGAQVSATRAVYDESHLRRLRLIRALADVGRLPLASIRKVVAAVEDEELDVHTMLGVAHHALSPDVEPHPEDDDWRAAREQVDALIRENGLNIAPDAPTPDELAQSIVLLARLDMPTSPESLRPYIAAARELVIGFEVRQIDYAGPRDRTVERMVIGTVLYGKIFDVLRRMFQESASAEVAAEASSKASAEVSTETSGTITR
ncbi:DNA-binding transcriptional MerR regulator [Thermocatellispora tengchongensis]|uniref:DNA-binding transcriptional MerR regulator n=1 Tax=Thermocatellispora tengchongensis TaxID=1073253 RepID=A0A840P2N9_9ACTN|nr:MerR family transcriptional regulator [Thermocatellispora tengchongensis]MBB5133249.1 DNA-binding transcriptional MerR regulator [Thermocatellispora tengchongensis]